MWGKINKKATANMKFEASGIHLTLEIHCNNLTAKTERKPDHTNHG